MAKLSDSKALWLYGFFVYTFGMVIASFMAVRGGYLGAIPITH
jgi:hypothetical protein